MQLNANLERPHPDENAATQYGLKTENLQELIKKVSRVLGEINQGVILGHGDLLVFDNLKALHSRTVIHEDDRQKGQERHLMRTQSYRDVIVQQKINDDLGASRQ
jgi:hypothetical protein